MSIISIRNLVKIRQKGQTRFRLEVDRLDVEPGAFVAVVGSSGSGKSTLLDLLALVLAPDSAEAFSIAPSGGAPVDLMALWDGRRDRPRADLRRRHFGYVLQTGGLLPFLTVRGNAELPYRLLGRRPDAARIVAVARRLGIEDRLTYNPSILSGGQRQRSAILRAIVHGPTIILADEPTAAVDRDRAIQIVGDLAALARDERRTVLMVTHDEALIAPHATVKVRFDVRTISEAETISTARIAA